MEKGRSVPCSSLLQLNYVNRMWDALSCAWKKETKLPELSCGWREHELSRKGQQQQGLERKMESDKRSYQQLQQLPEDTLGNLMS